MYFMIAIIMNLLEAKEPQGMVAARKQAVSQSVSQIFQSRIECHQRENSSFTRRRRPCIILNVDKRSKQAIGVRMQIRKNNYFKRCFIQIKIPFSLLSLSQSIPELYKEQRQTKVAYMDTHIYTPLICIPSLYLSLRTTKVNLSLTHSRPFLSYSTFHPSFHQVVAYCSVSTESLSVPYV